MPADHQTAPPETGAIMQTAQTFEGRFANLKQRYVAAVPDRVAAIAEVLSASRERREMAPLLEHQFHTLAGTAGTYGLHSLSAVATEGEETCAALGGRLLDDESLTHLKCLVDHLRVLTGDSCSSVDDGFRAAGGKQIKGQKGPAVCRNDAAAPRGSQDDDRFRDLVENSPDLICTHDLDGRIVTVNAAASRAVDIPKEILHSMRVQDLLAPDQQEGFAAYIGALKRDGAATGRMAVQRKDGRRRVWEYRTTLGAEGAATPIVFGVARDVTESVDVLKAVRRSEEGFRSIIENASDIIAIVEHDGRLRYHSPSMQGILGYAEHTLIGTSFVDLVHADDRDALSDILASKGALRDAVRIIELRMQHHDGGWRSFEVICKNLIENGLASAIVINARDITDRRFLETQLAQANRITSLGNLATTVAHEFNNVLMGMLPFAELLQRPGVSQATTTKAASHITSSIERGRRIALDILRFARPAEPDLHWIDLGEWWETFVPEAEAMLRNAISLVCTIPRRGLHILADNTQLSQVLSNLIANARDAMPDGGTITVAANGLPKDTLFSFGLVPHPERFIQVRVTDDGCGMPRHIREQVFEPLFTTKRNGGTGLGSAVAHQILTHHGGHLFVESEVGVGTTFHLFFPVAENRGWSSSDLPAAKHPPRPKRLMMIEDEPLIVDGIRDLLSIEGIEVDAIGRGSEALDAVTVFHPNIVLLDLGLPDMDGAEVYSRIRKVHPTLPVIFATGHGDRRVIQEELGDSRTRFLQKPFEMAALLELIAVLD
jgi:two-component system cell cycle sensor histidine kinase/response regulator CckA